MEPVMRLSRVDSYDQLSGQFGKDAASVGFAVRDHRLPIES